MTQAFWQMEGEFSAPVGTFFLLNCKLFLAKKKKKVYERFFGRRKRGRKQTVLAMAGKVRQGRVLDASPCWATPVPQAAEPCPSTFARGARDRGLQDIRGEGR